MSQGFKALSIILILAFLLIGCSNQPIEEQNEKTPADETKQVIDYFPIAKGSTWKYQGEGNEYASFSREVIFTEGNRAQFREDNGGTVISTIYEVTDDQVVVTFFQGEAYDDTNFLDHEPNKNQVIIKAPIEVGTKWEYDDETREIVDINATVDTPAGKFEDCIVVKILSSNSTTFEYFKAGVGLVKREFFTEGTTVTSVLEEFNISQ